MGIIDHSNAVRMESSKAISEGTLCDSVVYKPFLFKHFSIFLRLPMNWPHAYLVLLHSVLSCRTFCNDGNNSVCTVQYGRL